ncbi:hypothetical protein QQF64_013916 [Cirrhinus molitorella]|uniref:Uncharacterized protein n=1 Tax=Cirrhinus molitorella TaxID=172907 RepID=A0ABR3LTR8_9TELE
MNNAWRKHPLLMCARARGAQVNNPSTKLSGRLSAAVTTVIIWAKKCDMLSCLSGGTLDRSLDGSAAVSCVWSRES